MDTKDPRQFPAKEQGAAEQQTFARRISCSPPQVAPGREAPPLPGAHGNGREREGR